MNKNQKLLYSETNDMDPWSSIEHLKLPKLNDIEQMLIARVQPYMRIVRLQGGGVGYQGSILNVEQDISEVCNVLPHLPQDIPVFFVRKPVRSSSSNYKDYVINKKIYGHGSLF